MGDDALVTELKAIWAKIESGLETGWANYVYPLLQTIAKDEAPIIAAILEAVISELEGGFTVAKLSAAWADIVAAVEAKVPGVAESDLLAVAATVATKIASANAAASQAS